MKSPSEIRSDLLDIKEYRKHENNSFIVYSGMTGQALLNQLVYTINDLYDRIEELEKRISND